MDKKLRYYESNHKVVLAWSISDAKMKLASVVDQPITMIKVEGGPTYHFGPEVPRAQRMDDIIHALKIG